ncbi:PilZ domain-containing protein [Rhizobium sp. KVB221]|uniref:PilZ domain-containing protein n=1 Tax=Rhizobium setariae TaxID=2801340 RepID=A0A937CJH8_9HYPH|nr:PilZ domain-containing protein [Rhizobium setariae]MBL0371120.1 PilZ domain-containing protein [Rhizobium setariae]
MIISENAVSSVHTQSGLDARKYERFIINKPGSLMAIGAGLSGMTSRSCRVIDISKGGACVQVTTTIGLPDHYYLNFLGIPDRIGCAEVYRNGERIGVKFIKAIADDLLSGIVRNDFFTK